MKKNPLIIATQCFEGLGFAKLIKQQGGQAILACELNPEEMKDGEDETAEWNMNGEGIAEKMPLKEAVKKYGNSAYDWIFDSNHNDKTADALRKKGVKVLGGDALSGRMEHDRQYSAQIATKYGIPPPKTDEFKTIEEGLKHLEANPDKAYVYKPDEDLGKKWQTFVPNAEDPEEANEELSTYLESMDEDPGTFILQEKNPGVETNFEVWFYEGKPFFAFCGLEVKKKIAGDSVNHADPGENTGCAQDVVFQVPLDCRGVKETIGKLFPFYRSLRHTGFVDVNAMVSDRDAKFIEVCNRFGYNSHPNLFMTLAMDPFQDIIRNFIHGKVQGTADRFRFGFGASVSLYIEHKRMGLPITVSEDVWDDFFPYQFVEVEGKTFLPGYGNDVGMVAAHGYDLRTAAESAIKKVAGISYPGKSYRADLHKDDYPSSVIKRYEQLKAMNYI